jgi:hypothetical protein
MPLLKTPPACHAGPAAHLLREHLPRDARLKYEQNARECGSIAHARATALRLGSLFWQKRFYDRPQFVCYEWLRHRLSIPDRGVLLGALNKSGIEVASVEPGSPAAKAGVKGYEYNSQGQLQRADVITELQNTFLATDSTKLEYCNILSSNLRRQPDRALSMKVFRLEIGPEDDTWTELEGELNGTELRETDSVEVPTYAYGIRSV